MTHKTDFTPAQIERICRLRASGMSWQKIGEAMGCGKTRVRKAVDPEFVEYIRVFERSRQRKADADRKALDGAKWRVAGQRTKMTPQEIAERRPAPHRDYTALMFGDPAPGRSALDRRMQQ